MFLPEEELAVQVTQIDSVEIDDVDFAETREDEVLQELATDPASPNKEDAGLFRRSVSFDRGRWSMRSHLLDQPVDGAERLFGESFTRHGGRLRRV